MEAIQGNRLLWRFWSRVITVAVAMAIFPQKLNLLNSAILYKKSDIRDSIFSGKALKHSFVISITQPFLPFVAPSQCF